MTTDKVDALALIQRLPDGVSTETIITELQFRVTLLHRGGDAEHGDNIVPHVEAKRRLSAWLDSTGT